MTGAAAMRYGEITYVSIVCQNCAGIFADAMEALFLQLTFIGGASYHSEINFSFRNIF